MNATLHIDGGARGNPGPAAAGIVICEAATETPLYEAGIFLGRVTNNVAEYRALILGLERALALGVHRLRIFSDSELMVKQITGEYRVKSDKLQPLNEQAQVLLLKVDSWSIRHVMRSLNERADELANLSMDAGRDVIVLDLAAEGWRAAGPAAEGKASGQTPEQAPEEPPGEPPGAGACPRWTVTLASLGEKDCPAGCLVGRAYRFGPATPEGLCVHAAQAVFDDEPMFWPDRGLKSAVANCPRCHADIRIEMDS